VQQEDPLVQTGYQPIYLRPTQGLPGVGRCGLQPLQHAHLVSLGLEPPDEPRACIGESLIVQIDRILRGEHDAEAVGPRLLEKSQKRPLAGRLGDGREKTEDLIHVQQRAETGRAGLGAHPGDNLVEQHRHEEHSLGIGQVGDVEDGVPGAPIRRVQEARDIQRLSFQPALEPG
jgi:hypothetical protein